MIDSNIRFASCPSDIGLYPIVDSVVWVERLLSSGVSTIQLRIKNQRGKELQQSIRRSIHLAQQYQARLYINDHWQDAIKFQAYGVHLGQQDIRSADLAAIAQAGLRLGISTHCDYEIKCALNYHPSYIAFGPIYPTTAKTMPFTPRGIAQLSYWRSQIERPLVAIGGINLTRLPEVLACGVDGIAVISAITQAADPAQCVKQFLRALGC